MNNVVSINSKKPHMTGGACCISCKHEWIAVAPVGTVWLQCPECLCEKGRFKYPVSRKDIPSWVCNCGNDLFLINPDGCFCPNCGDKCEFGNG